MRILFLLQLSDCGNGNLQFFSSGVLYFLGVFPGEQNCRNYSYDTVFACGNVIGCLSFDFSHEHEVIWIFYWSPFGHSGAFSYVSIHKVHRH